MGNALPPGPAPPTNSAPREGTEPCSRELIAGLQTRRQGVALASSGLDTPCELCSSCGSRISVLTLLKESGETWVLVETVPAGYHVLHYKILQYWIFIMGMTTFAIRENDKYTVM